MELMTLLDTRHSLRFYSFFSYLFDLICTVFVGFTVCLNRKNVIVNFIYAEVQMETGDQINNG